MADNDNTKKTNKFIQLVKVVMPYVFILVGVVLFRTFIATPIIVSGDSMNPTLKNGELMILNKLGKYDRFDIVVVHINSHGKKEDIIKRVIALPGETISCENGIVYVNGVKQEEEYSQGRTEDFQKIELGDDEYFVMGDNRQNSADSRLFGPFKASSIKGTTNFVLFPLNKIGKVE